MPDLSDSWRLPPTTHPPAWFVQVVQQYAPAIAGTWLAQLLWQRGLHDPKKLLGFLQPAAYQPTSPFAFGEEMTWAVERLQQAHAKGEKVAIWGDFDADGVTATAVLWDGLGQFFTQHKTLMYYIPNRLTESHGLSCYGIDRLQAANCHVIVTCDTGSTNRAEIDYAIAAGMDVIVTDHHTLPAERPPVVALINPRTLPADHPLASLSGVAVAYKLVEALYATLPSVPKQPLTRLLDLVAIGLIADLVELKGDCRYLAQVGIEQLQRQANPATATRPGVAKLLEFCKRTGDRPTDISFGLGPRINAVSRIQGDAHFCVELLTSPDQHLCSHFAEATELANTRRKALQKDVLQQVTARVATLDLSTTSVIVLADEQWPLGVLGLVAGQIAQDYGRPTILLTLPTLTPRTETLLAYGSARSVNNIDLYQLVKGQEHLLHRFGGHPYAAGLSLPVANLPLFTEAINQQLRQTLAIAAIAPALQADLTVTVADLGKALFQELKLLEPCGIGNPVPRLFLQNVWFMQIRNKKLKDRTGRKIEYIKTAFTLWDDTVETGFPGSWWGHYASDIPTGRCDAIAELDFNAYERQYEVRLIAVRPHAAGATIPAIAPDFPLLDWRPTAPEQALPAIQLSTLAAEATPAPLVLRQCPSSWIELQTWIRQAQHQGRPLAIAYGPPATPEPLEVWTRLVGLAKYLSRTQTVATRQQLRDKLELGDRPLHFGLQALAQLGFTLTTSAAGIHITYAAAEGDRAPQPPSSPPTQAIRQFLIAVKEEQFHRQYFAQLSVATIAAIARQTAQPDSFENECANLPN